MERLEAIRKDTGQIDSEKDGRTHNCVLSLDAMLKLLQQFPVGEQQLEDVFSSFSIAAAAAGTMSREAQWDRTSPAATKAAAVRATSTVSRGG